MNAIIRKLDSPQGICLILLMMLSPVLIYSCSTILYQISAERTPHKYWYMFRDGKKKWQLTPANTQAERDNAEAWIHPMPLAITWKHNGRHRLTFHNLKHTITVLTIRKNRITHMSTISPTARITGTVHCRHAVILDHKQPTLHTGDVVTLRKRHVDIWDY